MKHISMSNKLNQDVYFSVCTEERDTGTAKLGLAGLSRFVVKCEREHA